MGGDLRRWGGGLCCWAIQIGSVGGEGRGAGIAGYVSNLLEAL